MKKRFTLLFAALLFIAGICILLYPTARTAAFRKAEQETIQRFAAYRAEHRMTDTVPTNVSPAEKETLFPELWEACAAFNERLYKTRQAAFTAETLILPSLDLAEYGWDSEVFATLSIPTADIKAPLYLGASAYNLNRGAAILGQTSLPIGGENTNCVIAGHRTWSAVVHFRSLEDVETGDPVYLTNPWETLVYQVVSIEIIPPDSLDLVRIQPGRDLLSVFTCTNSGTQRVLVTCERIKEEDK